MNVATFYADNHLGSRFGIKGHAWPTYHHGQDINGWPAGTPIPSYVAGKVSATGWSATLGWVLVVKASDGWHYGYCHLHQRSHLPVGATVYVGTVVGYLGNTGSASKGPHLHTTREPTAILGTERATDPLPKIKAARTSPAGGGVTPFPPEEKRYPVRIVQDTSNNKYYRIGEFTVLELAPSVAQQEAQLWGNGVALPHATVLQLIADANSARSGAFATISVDAGGLTAAQAETLDTIAAKVTGLRVPTAEENGAAARHAIVKGE